MSCTAGVSPQKLSHYRETRASLPMLYLILTTWLNACPLGRPGTSWFACHLLLCPAPHARVGTWATYKGDSWSWGRVLPSTWFCISQPGGQFICVTQGLLFEGNMLAYDLVSNEAEWIPVWGTASDLSQVEEALARELSNMVLHNSDDGVRRFDQFGEQGSESGWCGGKWHQGQCW